MVSISLKTMLNISWLGPEQSFLHQRVMMDAKKLDKENLVEYIDFLHQQYLLRNKLFTNLVCWCTRNGVELPPLTELFEDRKVNHPLEAESGVK